MSNFFRWLADVGPTLGRRSKSRWADVGSHRRADGCADVGPTLARRQHAIWESTIHFFCIKAHGYKVICPHSTLILIFLAQQDIFSLHIFWWAEQLLVRYLKFTLSVRFVVQIFEVCF